MACQPSWASHGRLTGAFATGRCAIAGGASLSPFYTAVETNGTQPLPVHVDWLCVSPKAGTTLVLGYADELKLVYPQPGAEPERFASFSALHRWFVADGRAAPDQAQHGKGCSLLSRASRMAVGYPGAQDMEDAVTATRYRPPPHPLSKPN